MTDKDKEQLPLDELTREIRRVIEDNRKFLDKVLDEDFEPEDELADEPPPEIEV